MAWMDDRIWAHPKHANVGWRARAVAMYAICYSSGFGLYGNLTPQQQHRIGASPAIRKELIDSQLWDDAGDGNIVIHDWDEHNGERDRKVADRRTKDRERKRLERAEKSDVSYRTSEGHDADKRVDKLRTSDRTPPARGRREGGGGRPMTSDEVTEEQQQQGPTTPAPDPAAAAGLERLKAAGWANGQLDAAQTDLPRALALLDHCQTDPTATNPAGLAWTKYQRGDQAPTPPKTIAPGATGTRSTTTRNPHECPACFSTFRTAKRLAEHITDLHAITNRTPPPTELRALLGQAAPHSIDDEPGPADDEPGPAAA